MSESCHWQFCHDKATGDVRWNLRTHDGRGQYCPFHLNVIREAYTEAEAVITPRGTPAGKHHHGSRMSKEPRLSDEELHDRIMALPETQEAIRRALETSKKPSKEPGITAEELPAWLEAFWKTHSGKEEG